MQRSESSYWQTNSWQLRATSDQEPEGNKARGLTAHKNLNPINNHMSLEADSAPSGAFR